MDPVDRRTLLARIGLCGATAMTTACAPSMRTGPVVLAASSLEGCLDAILNAWGAFGYDVPLGAHAATPALVRQMEAGAPADLAITADRAWMQVLGDGNLVVPDTIRAIAGNRLDLVWPLTRNTARPATIADAVSAGSVALAEPDSVPAGRYAKVALTSLGLWSGVAPRIIPTDSARAALALAERGEVDAAIVYASDARASERVVSVASFDEALHPPIRYFAARASRSVHPDSDGLLAHLASESARRVFAEHGFSSS
ncbi:MAG: molybdate ABC transporter substrate-binding protein [Parerythrobacter sp.]